MRSNLYPTNSLEFVIQGIKDKLNEEVTEIQASELDYEISNTIKLIEDTSSEQVMDTLLYHLEQLLNQKRANLNVPLVFTEE